MVEVFRIVFYAVATVSVALMSAVSIVVLRRAGRSIDASIRSVTDSQSNFGDRLADIEHVLNMRSEDDGDIRRVNSDVILRLDKRVSEIERCIKGAGD